MKQAIYTTLLIFCCAILQAQDSYSKSYKTNDIEVVDLNFKWGDLNVTFADVDEVKVSYDLMINGESATEAIDLIDKKRKGVLILDGDMDFDKVEERITLIYHGDRKLTMTKDEFEQREASLEEWDMMNTGYNFDGHINITIPKNKIVKLETTYGNIEIMFDGSKREHDLSVHSTYGHVDMSIPASISTDLDMSSSYGEIYSDIDFRVKSDYTKRSDCQFGDHIKAILNTKDQGNIALEATYDNIYLRKI